VQLTNEDFDNITQTARIFFGTSSSYLRFSSALVKDMNANAVQAIANGAACRRLPSLATAPAQPW